jgi:hypothetical protein
VIVGEIGAERALRRFVRAEGAREHIRDRAPPVADRRHELDERAHTFARAAERVPAAAQRPEPARDPFHVADNRVNAGARTRKTVDKRRPRRGKAFRQHERLA